MSYLGKAVRYSVVSLALSASAFVGITQREGYTDNTIIPTKGDRPTNGFGSTIKEDGSPVAMGERTNPVAAMRRALVHIERDEAKIKQCVTAPLSQAEYDVYVDLAYNIGTPGFCSSTIVKRLNTFDYRGACDAILMWKKAGGFDCSTPGNKRCAGLWTDRLHSHQRCVAAAEAAS